MTLQEQYNQYVQEWIKENPAFSYPYEPMLEFDEWIYNYIIEFAEWFALRYTEEVFYRENYTKDLLEEFKKEKGL